MEEKIDINVADVETLASLPGIGLKRAAQIVDYRTAVHPFEEVIELAAVPGISQRMVDEIADLITVAGAVEDVETMSPVEPAGVEEIAVIDDDDGVEETAEISGPPPAVETEAETAEADVVEEEPDEIESEASPVVVTMLEPEHEPPEPTERALITPPIRPAQQTVVQTVPRQHSHLWQNFLAMVGGIVFGSMLTLLLLFLLNGTLRFDEYGRANEIQLQLDEETSAIRQSQSSMADELGGLAGRLTALDSEQAASEAALGAVADDVSGLEEQTAELAERLETIDLAAEKFDTFLTGMRDLLVALQGLPAVPGPTGAVTATTTLSATVAPEITPANMTPTPTVDSPAGAAPTRTPRPTATPLIESGG